MEKKAYVMPTVQADTVQPLCYICGDNSIPSGGTGGPGIAEGKEREDEKAQDDSWGSLW